MTYKEAMIFLQREAGSGTKLGLESIGALMTELGNPQNELRYIHVAGTNGKGSVCASLDSVLRRAGYRTGLFTSPSLNGYNEHICMKGRAIEEGDIACLVPALTAASARVEARGIRAPTAFELMTALAFLYYRENACEIVVLETGMGGREDATNVIGCPELAVISSIGYDHMRFLGDSIETIAEHKAGIIKAHGTVVVLKQDRTVMNVIERVCAESEANLRIADSSGYRIREQNESGTEFDYGDYKALAIGLAGEYQIQNAILTVKVLEALREKGYGISENAIREGLKTVHWPGRFECISRSPDIIVDGAHNPQGAQALANSIRQRYPGKRIGCVIGMLADKDCAAVIRAIEPISGRFYAFTPPDDRALDGSILAEEIQRTAGEGRVAISVDIRTALEQAIRESSAEDVICVMGSLSHVSTARKIIMGSSV